MTETEKNALRVKVAELCGWRRPFGGVTIGCQKPDGTWLTSPNIKDTYKETLLRLCPDYPNDLNAGAELIDLLAEKGLRCELSNGLFNQQTIPHKWRASFIKKIGAKEYCAWAETLATAICLAFVKTMEEKQ